MSTVNPSFSEMVAALVKPAAAIVKMHAENPEMAHLQHMTLGLTGETGELTDAIKKHTVYGKQLDVENVIEELGDIEFYLEGLRQALSITRKETLDRNQEKLAKRYHTGGYSDNQAQQRADKAE